MKTNRQEPLPLSPQNNRRTRAGRRLLFRLALLALILAAGMRLARAQEQMFVLDEATAGAPYSAQVATAGAAPFAWQLLDGTIPPGLAFTSDGKLSGNPTAPSATPYRFKMRVTDSSIPHRTTEQWLSLTVLPMPPPPPLIGATAVVVPAPTPIPPPPPPFVITTSSGDEETIALTETYRGPDPGLTFGTDTSNVPALNTIIGATVGTSTQQFSVGDYCAIHLIAWKPLVENKSEPDREIWALFKAEASSNPTHVKWVAQEDTKNKDVFATRIFGRRRVAFLLVHFDTPRSWDVKYKVSVNQKIPTPIQHVLELLGSVAGGGGAKDATKDIWGARMMLVKYESSELVVKLNAVSTGPGGRPVEQSKEHSNTYVNEGKYHWDVSVGLPVQSVRQLTFKSDGGRVFAESKEKQSVYGFLDLYPWKVDLKGESYLTKPHFSFGVPLASKPLQRPFAGIGSGVFKTPIKFNFFAGIVFIRERVPGTLGEGSAATTGQLEADLRTRWVRKGMFGISLPIGQIKDAIKK